MIELEKTEKEKYFYRVKARNGETLVHSEIYDTKQAAIKGIRALYNVISEDFDIGTIRNRNYKTVYSKTGHVHYKDLTDET
jgi:uncharacterized protein YegP (UPF0339 family)